MVKHKKAKAVSRHQQQKKKRPRTTSDDASGDALGDQVVAANNDATTDSQMMNIVTAVTQWLESRRKPVPSVLKRENAPTDMDQIMKLLPDLRERERRALIRKVAKTMESNEANNEPKHRELDGSDNEYSEGDANARTTSPIEWPLSFVEFSNNYRWDASVPQEIKDKYRPTDAVRHRVNRLSSKVYFKIITDRNHPACGEYGLFCALPDGAPPGTWLLDYVGHITLGEDQNKQSDYVSDFGEHSELACDANTYGNEARFLNDFRNTGRYPNVEFNFRRDKRGELRQGVYVKLAKDAKDPGFKGVNQHEELLVSYGKSYWRSRHSDLTEFVYRYPGQEAPKI